MKQLDHKLVNRICILEAWERFGYYGMRALLVLFMVKELNFGEGHAYIIYGLYAAICYIVPVLGGVLADRFFGYKKLLSIGSVLMCAGYFILALIDFLYLGLSLVAIGTGFFKGNVTNIFGSVFEKHNQEHRDTGFRKFYIAVNFGSLIGASLCGVIAHHFGWRVGFATAGLGMLIGYLVFLSSQELLKDYGNDKHDYFYGNCLLYLCGLALVVISTIMFYYVDFSISVISVVGVLILLHLVYVITKLELHERRSIYLILIMLFFLMLMFAIEMQLGSFFNIFTDKHINRELFGITIPTASLQSLNPLTIILLGPLMTLLLRKTKQKCSLIIFGSGFVLNMLCFLVLFLGSFYTDAQGKINILLLVLSMALMASGEIMMAPIVQSVVTKFAPENMRGYMMGITMLCLSYSNILGSVVLKKLLSLPEGSVDNIHASISRYQGCFLKLTIIFVVLSVFYILLYKTTRKLFVYSQRKKESV